MPLFQSAIPVAEAHSLPRWRRPESLLMLLAVASPLAYATWMALINNFVIERAAFDGLDIGALHVAREIPGFLAFLVIYLLLFLHEQTIALVALLFLGLFTALTANFPTFWGLMVTTLLSSLGFHYYETIQQSLQLQWLPKDRAPQVIGLIVSAASFGSLVVYGMIILAWEGLGIGYTALYWAAGGACAAVTLAAWFLYPRFEGAVVQHKKFILRPRYWLYYALVFIGGARRQIFIIFAPFMMVERFGMHVHEVTGLMLFNYVATMMVAPYAGRMVRRFGERAALVVEYVGLATVFGLYAGIYYFHWGVWLAMGLYVADHLLFALAIAQKTYLQKIADPADQAPTAAVSFTINHIAAITLPVPMGLLWLSAPGAVYGLAAALALVSLGLAFLVPRHPSPGNETVLRPRAVPAE